MIFITSEYAKLVIRGYEEPPDGCIAIEYENWALFYECDDDDWRCDVLVQIGLPPLENDAERDLAEQTRGKITAATWAYFQRCKQLGINFTTAESRTCPDDGILEKMMIVGHRYSLQVDKAGRHYGIRTKSGRVCASEEALGCEILNQIVTNFIAPLFGGTLEILNEALQDSNNIILPTRHPFTLMSCTENYRNYNHVDESDLFGSVVLFLQAGDGEIDAGKFVISSHGCYVQPLHGTTMYIRSQDVAHYTLRTTRIRGSRVQLGLAFAVRKNAVTGLNNQARNELHDEAAGPLLATLGHISEELRQIPVFAAILDKTDVDGKTVKIKELSEEELKFIESAQQEQLKVSRKRGKKGLADVENGGVNMSTSGGRRNPKRGKRLK